MTVFLRTKRTSSRSIKRRIVTSGTSVSRKCSSTQKTKSLVPKRVTRRMVEEAVALDTRKIIGIFSEKKKWKSLSDLRTINEEDQKTKEKTAKLLVENEKLTKDLGTVTLKTRDIERQLIYERAFYEEQKSQYAKVMRNRVLTRNVKTQTYEVDFVYESEKVCSLISELRTLRELFSRQKSTIVEVCDKYLRMRTLKEYLLQEMVKTEERHRQISKNILDRFDKERISFATVDRDGRLSQEQHRTLVERSSKLAYNNAALQMRLHSVISSKARVCPRSLSSDLFIYSTLKEIRDLSETENNMWTMMDNRRVWASDLDNEEEVIGKFISFPVEVADGGSIGYKLTPLFRIEDVDEEQDFDEDDLEEVEVDSEEMTGRSESTTDIKKVNAVPPRSDSAPDIIRATFLKNGW